MRRGLESGEGGRGEECGREAVGERELLPLGVQVACEQLRVKVHVAVEDADN